MAENPWIPLLELTGNYQVEDFPELATQQLIARATKAKEDAKKEIAYGETIGEILGSDGESGESKSSLATIGVWHFECAVELFEKAIRNYERAKARNLSKDQQKQVESQIKICRKYLAAVDEQRKTAGDLLGL